jgi:integrase
LGHSSIKVTADTYGHLIPGGNREAVDRLDWDLEKSGIGTVTETVTKSNAAAS